jgi:flagellar hook-associated protein 1 FlgK
LNAALSGLSVTADQTSVVSRNIARAGDATASRKIANVITVPGAGVKLASVTRAVNSALFDKLMGATSDAAAQKAITDALDQLDKTINDPELDASPGALIGRLSDAIQRYAAAPQDIGAAISAVAAASDLARSLNDATRAVQQVRSQADADMAASVANIQKLLAQFETVNKEIVKGTQRGADVTDYLDQRDQILASLSQEVGIRTVTRAGNDMAIYTDSGVTLFDVEARAVTFNAQTIYTAATTGSAVYVDGVPITGSSGPMLAGSGRLTGLAKIRDSIAVTYQDQLDEIARGLIAAFAESDQSTTPTLPDVPGLFTYAGSPAMPASGTLLVGIAGSIRVSASVDPTQGGDPNRLRDGAISGNPAYLYNASGSAGYTQRLEELQDRLNAHQAFDATAQLGSWASVGALASSSVSWLQEMRKSATSEADYKSILKDQASSALSRITGVNIDEEMTLMLDLERSYQASAKIMAAIDSMLGSLMEAVR